MCDAREPLAETYREFSDEYLIELIQSDCLTEIARSAAQEELATRGVAIPEHADIAGEQAGLEPVELATVARVFTPLEAHILRARLETEGIPAVLADENLVQLNNLLAIAVGGIRVQVPAAYVGQAEEVILAIRRGEFTLDDNSEP